MILRLLHSEISISEQARNGLWCALPYPNHKKGCPNIGREGCPPDAPKFEDIAESPYYAVIVPFNLKEHAEKMRVKHPEWTERQCRNLLYWQGGVKKKLKQESYELKDKLEEAFDKPFLVLEIPEANGVNIFTTMFKAGRRMQVSKPDIIHKVMIVVGDKKNGF